jgi:hypothetical protein
VSKTILEIAHPFLPIKAAPMAEPIRFCQRTISGWTLGLVGSELGGSQILAGKELSDGDYKDNRIPILIDQTGDVLGFF